MSKRRVSEPGYRYANERRAYLALTPAQRLKAKKWMEAVWNDRSCEARYKNQVPCPTLLENETQED